MYVDWVIENYKIKFIFFDFIFVLEGLIKFLGESVN